MEKYVKAQNIARDTMHEMHGFIRVGMSEKQIFEEAIALMTQKGSNGWWYHGLGALVLLGSRSVESLSGTQYQPSESNLVAENDIITIDLAPTFDGYWGDYARTIFVEDGEVAGEDRPLNEEFRLGLAAEQVIHAKLMAITTPDMTFESLFWTLNAEIKTLGFENLDFHGNLGHSIEFDQADRIYIEEGNQVTLAECGKPFTLEPHIRKIGGAFGYKREDIYYFDEEYVLTRL